MAFLHPENIRKNMLVAVEGHITQYRYTDSYTKQSRRYEGDFTGHPLRVTAVSLPWICVFNGEERFAIDTRVWKLCTVTREYAAEMLSAAPTAYQIVQHKKSKNQEKPDPRQCPKCGHRMHEQLSALIPGVWKIVCGNCGYDGGDSTVFKPTRPPKKPTRS